MEHAYESEAGQRTLKRRGAMGVGIVLILLGTFIAWHEFAAPADAHHDASAPATVDESHPEASATHHEDDHQEDGEEATHTVEAETHHAPVPAWYSVLPFVILLLCIAILPLFHKTEHWWEKNQNRLLVAVVLGVITLGYYAFVFGHGVHDHIGHGHSEPGIPAALTVLKNAVMGEYIPFITLLFSLYVITGGISIEGRFAGKPSTNASIIGFGALIASFVGTTGAAMLLIRPLLNANAKRNYIAHTVIFFIFAVCNTGGCLLPIGDPPLFLGFLRGVDFFWTLKLWPEWLTANIIIVAVYFVWDTIAAKKEAAEAFVPQTTEGPLIKLGGKLNLLLLLGIIFCVATLDPSKPFPGTNWHAPLYFRELLMFAITLCSLLITTVETRAKNSFNYDAIFEVAALFIGIFICMQAPVGILNEYGSQLGIDTPMEFFWGTGTLSSFLDNAPTYVVFFETAKTMPTSGPAMAGVAEVFLVAISLGSVFMGAMTYIGNGPNFMVKAIAEKNNVRMPSFFGYMFYSVAVLVPIFLLVTLIFL